MLPTFRFAKNSVHPVACSFITIMAGLFDLPDEMLIAITSQISKPSDVSLFSE